MKTLYERVSETLPSVLRTRNVASMPNSRAAVLARDAPAETASRFVQVRLTQLLRPVTTFQPPTMRSGFTSYVRRLCCILSPFNCLLMSNPFYIVLNVLSTISNKTLAKFNRSVNSVFCFFVKKKDTSESYLI